MVLIVLVSLSTEEYAVGVQRQGMRVDAVEFQQLSDVAGCLAQAMFGQKGYLIQHGMHGMHGMHGIQLDKLAMEPHICGHTLFDYV